MYRHIEEYSLNAWPALQTVVFDGWLLRFSEGYTKRSNSIQTLYDGMMNRTIGPLLEDKIRTCELLYDRKALATIFKITPYSPPELDHMLEGKGYEVVDPTWVKVLRNLSDIAYPQHEGIVMEEELNDTWLDAMAHMNGLSDAAKQVTMSMMRHSPFRKGYFILYEDDQPIACGLAVIEHESVGLYDIVTEPAYRNRGYAQQLILHILHWARSCGALSGYLQVVQSNTAANRLYDKLGYETVYDYWYRYKPYNHND